LHKCAGTKNFLESKKETFTCTIQKCVAICWFMVVQDPEMYIDGDLQPGIQFDKEVYREFTRSGKRVAFSVWPALYLPLANQKQELPLAAIFVGGMERNEETL
jgi:hypothetical protein